MKLSAILGINIADKNVILVGKPELTIHKSRDGEAYYMCKTQKPVLVSCSTDKNIMATETDEVYLRESAIEQEGWQFVDEKDPSKGFFMPGWVVDFSKNAELPMYQGETILEWSKGNRQQRNLDKTSSINEKLRAKLAAKGRQ